jgi:outer membrane biosynthesis protein TonB
MATSKTTERGRPVPLHKTSVPIDGGSVNLSVFDDGRVQVSIPGDWVITNMAGNGGRKRVDFATQVVALPSPAPREKASAPAPAPAPAPAAGLEDEQPPVKKRATRRASVPKKQAEVKPKSVSRKPKPAPKVEQPSEPDQTAEVTEIRSRRRRRQPASAAVAANI